MIHTGIDSPERLDLDRASALRKEWAPDGAGPLVVTLARLSYEKGVDTLIDAAAILRSSHPYARFVVVGEGSDRAELEARISAGGLAGIVKLVGFRDDVWPALAAADVVCLPSKSEGMPNVLLEAMAVGKPIVATSVGGVPEAIESGENGLLAGPGDPQALAAEITRLADDSALAQRLGAAARRTMEARFRARDVVARYAEVYQRLLMQQGGKRASLATAG